MEQHLKNQYQASLGMLKQCIEQYDENVWLDAETYTDAAWQIAYHVIFFTNIYCCPREQDIVSWPNETENYQILGKTPWPPHEKIILEKSYSREEILSFLSHVSEHIPEYLESLEIDEKCWPFWYDLSQLEFQINNLRHIQHHTGQLLERQCTVRKISVGWACFK